METTENTSFIEKENYASNGKANAGLTLGIIGTALSGLGILGGAGSLLSSNSTSKTTMTTQDYVDITKEYYKQRISDLKELTQTFYSQDQKISDNYKATRDSYDILAARISELEKQEAVNAATQPLYQQIEDMKINLVNQSAQSGISAANAYSNSLVNMEAYKRKSNDNILVNYMNGMFQPVQIQDPTYGTTGTQRVPYNPLQSNTITED